MNASQYRSQAALCFRIHRSIPQDHIAAEILRIAAEFEAQAAALEGASAIPLGGNFADPTLPDLD